jgi:ribosomal protein L11 methyltransferase
MQWRQFVMDLGRLDSEAVETLLFAYGALAVTFCDAGDVPLLEPAPGETPLWHDTNVLALFNENTDFNAVAAGLRTSLGLEALPRYRVETLADRDWGREWRKDLGPMRFGRRLWVCPAESVPPPDAVVVRLDPGLAFGTGTHATTALCLEWLDGLELAGRTLLDYGCGSGLLAIAALKLGCRSATGIDIDPQARTSTLDNALRNGVAEKLSVVGHDRDLRGPYDVVVANILAGPLVDLSQSVITRLSSGGELALSGILSGQVDRIQAAYDPWIKFDAPAFRSQDGQNWARLAGKRRSS